MRRLITVQIDRKRVIGAIMDYAEMIEGIMKRGKKAMRSTWGDGEYLWSDGSILIHNTPYWEQEKKNEKIDGYPYVCECKDVLAHDWKFV